MEKIDMVRRVKYMTEITKSEAKRAHLKTIDDVYSYAISKPDQYPEEGKSIRIPENCSLRDIEAMDLDYGMKEFAQAYTLKFSEAFLTVSFTVLEFYKADEEGEWCEGSDYDQFAEFSEDDKEVILDFLEFAGG